MKAFRFACEFDSSMKLEHVMEQELSGERGEVREEVPVKHVEEHEPLLDGDEDVLLEEVLVKHVEENKPLLDGDEDMLVEASQHVKAHESLSNVDEHVLIEQRTGPSSTQRKIIIINRATMDGSSIQPDSNSSDEKKRPQYFAPAQGEDDNVLATVLQSVA